MGTYKARATAVDAMGIIDDSAGGKARPPVIFVIIFCGRPARRSARPRLRALCAASARGQYALGATQLERARIAVPSPPRMSIQWGHMTRSEAE